MADFDFAELKDERRRELFLTRTRNEDQDPARQNEGDAADGGGGLLSGVADVALAPFRGVEGAVQDVYGLADTLAGDVLPDYDSRFLGESHTGVGQLVEGVANFATGFIPVAGWLGRAGKIGRFVNLTREAEKGFEAASAAAKLAGVAGEAASFGRKAKLIGAGRAALAGAITDFAVFDGHEARLSNLIESFPSLENPLTDYLAADDNDSQLEGRLKATIEGLGVGLLTDALFLGVKALRAGKRHLEFNPKATSEEVQAAMDTAVPPKEMENALDRYNRGEKVSQDELFSAVQDEVRLAKEAGIDATPEAGSVEARLAKGEKVSDAQFNMERRRTVEDAQWSADSTNAMRRFNDTEVANMRAEREAKLAADALPPSSEALLSHVLGDDDAAKALLSRLDERSSLTEAKAVAGGGPGTAALNPRDLSRLDKLDLELSAKNLNLQNFRGSEKGLELIRAVEDLYGQQMEKEVANLNRPHSTEDIYRSTVEALEDLTHSQSSQPLMRELERGMVQDNQLLAKVNARARARKVVLMSYSDAVATKADEALRASIDDPKALLEFKEMAETLADMVAGVKGLSAEQGRGLWANRLETRSLISPADVGFDKELLSSAVQNAGGTDKLKELAARFKAAFGEGGLHGAASVTKLAQTSKTRAFWNVTNEYWINAILSGAKTMVVNGLGGLVTSVYLPMEAMLGSGIKAGEAALRGDKAASRIYTDQIADAFHEITSLVYAAPEALKLAKVAALTGENIHNPYARVADIASSDRNAIKAATFGADQDSLIGKGIDYIGKVVRIPSGILSGTDEFVKQLNYRSTARSQLMREAITKKIPKEEIAGWVHSKMESLIYQGQAFSSASVFRQGLDMAKAKGITHIGKRNDFAREYAKKVLGSPDGKMLSRLSKFAVERGEEATFTRALDPKSISASVQNTVNAHPYLRLVMPFVRTPINILKFTGQRLDVVGAAQVLGGHKFPSIAKSLEGSRRRLVMDMMSHDPRKAADAAGRLAAGMSIAAFGYNMAMQGTITGKGPADPEQRKILEASGWQQYSIKTDKGYISYARLDPFATLIGTFADMTDYGRYGHHEDQGGIEQATYAVATALAQNFTNKSYLTGLSNVIEALQEPGAKLPKILQRYAGSFVPSAVAGATELAGDEYTRDARNMIDALTARVPGLSATLPPMRNVLGEPIKKARSVGGTDGNRLANFIMPVAYRETSDDVVSQELASLGHGFTPPKREYNGIDLNTIVKGGQTAYDRWGELHGEVKIGGHNLRDTLRRTIQSKEYKKLASESTGDLDSPRIAVVGEIIQDFRRAALKKLMREYPDLAALDRQFVRKKRELSLGIQQTSGGN